MIAVRAFVRFVSSLAILLSFAAHADPPLMLGVRGGVSAPSALELSAGPMVGADLTVGVWGLWAFELGFEHSWHDGPQLSQGTLGVQYRLDVGRVVPYVTVAAEGARLDDRGRSASLLFGGAVGLGVFGRFGESWFWGAEARYGVGTEGFPSRQTFLTRLGWRLPDS